MFVTILPGILPNVCFILKKELLRIPFFGWGLALIDPIAIDRNKSLHAFKKVVEDSHNRLRNNLKLYKNLK